MNDKKRERLRRAARDVREHFDRIDQDVPDSSFIVGGYVRDTIMGLGPNDMDFVVVNETPESMRERGFEPIEASSFPVFHDSEHEEWALARTEQKIGDGYTGFEVFTDDVSLEDDLERRDLSINSMALDVRTDAEAYQCSAGFTEAGEGWGLIDPHNGVEDIENQVLSHVSEAFAEDPLRILRVARYAARFPGFSVEGESDENPMRELVGNDTMSLMRSLVPELNRMSRDRIGTEIRKAMDQARRPSRFWEVLRGCGALAVIWPELDRASIIPAGPPEYHYESAYMFEK